MTQTTQARPAWLTRRVSAGHFTEGVFPMLRDLRLNTVCQSADCPNMGECFHAGTATFLILGAVCTRRCRFCAVTKGVPEPLDPDEPRRLLEAVRQLKLSYVVITSVTRDDLPDGGAAQFAACIRLLKESLPGVKVEVLIPDFLGKADSIRAVLEAGPAVLNHNVETVPELYLSVRPKAIYARSLDVLRQAAGSGIPAKSGIMVGLGESPVQVNLVFRDLAAAGVSIVTVGQYLPPSPKAFPLVEYVHPDQFNAYADMARAAGIAAVSSGPLVRSSYRAGELLG